MTGMIAGHSSCELGMKRLEGKENEEVTDQMA